MKVDETLLNTLREMVSVKFNQTLKTPADFNLLSDDIFKETKRSVSVSTLKRIWGYVSSPHGTSFSSLSILARYVGYSDWDSFSERIKKETPISPTSGFGSNAIILSSSLPLSSSLLIEWRVNKRAKLRKINEPDVFKIEESENIKLLSEDIGKIECFALNRPLVITDCHRDGENLGTYTGAVKEGIASIKCFYPG